MTIRESICNNKREKIYLQYYDQGQNYFWFEDLPLDKKLEVIRDFIRESFVEEEREFPYELNFSIVNKWMVKKEKVLKEEYNAQNLEHMQYRPFFMEFSGFCKWNQIEELFLNIFNEEMKYLAGYFFQEDDQSLINFKKENWIDGKKIIAIIQGNLMISASPIEVVRGALVIVEDHSKIDLDYLDVLNDSIYSCKKSAYTCINYGEVQTLLDSDVTNGTPRMINVYNVGQGLCASIHMDNGGVIFSDIGITKDKIELSSVDIIKAKQEIGMINPDLVVLSHWDLDHILGVTNASEKIYDATWIVPDLWGLIRRNRKGSYEGVSKSAIRLLKYLDWRNGNNLFIIADDVDKTRIYKNSKSNIEIWTGIRKNIRGKNKNNEEYCITKANNFGLILYLENEKTALLPGDCEYSAVDSGLLNKEINYLVVPHHCSKMSEPSCNASSDDKKAIISYGICNNYGHPDNLHMQQLHDKGYEIITTIGRDKITLYL